MNLSCPSNLIGISKCVVLFDVVRIFTSLERSELRNWID